MEKIKCQDNTTQHQPDQNKRRREYINKKRIISMPKNENEDKKTQKKGKKTSKTIKY